ncbi:GNAT family N-acetyltransferase [Burkholderia alba]|uniref:GNAT family N-acetyltransferase n=1 Tax=Burkholderia alba TaxID=2683677 RepID=UPI002B05E7F2|nr:GNAT family N-acetyltransferase [Burkholderia alba]
MSSVEVRLAVPEDVPALGRLFDLYRQFYEQAPDAELAERFIGERMRRRESIVLAAQQADGAIVGFCQLYPTFCSVEAAPILVLYDLFVAPAARGTGAGKALLLAARLHAVAAGVARLDLSTARTNRAAQTLYESLGWERDDVFYAYHLTP